MFELDIKRDYTKQDVIRLRGSYDIEYSIAKITATKLRSLMSSNGGTRALGALTGCQAVQMVLAGLSSIYLSGWQVAADANGHCYPDQSLYPCDRVPKLIEAINNALLRQDKIDSVGGNKRVEEWLVPIVADIEAGFGGELNVFEITRQCIKAGAAAVHLEDQLSSEKKCGHLGGKVLVPTQNMVNKLKAARLAMDVCGTPTVLIARTDANSAKLLTSDMDCEDRPFINRVPGVNGPNVPDRTEEGFYRIKGGLEQAIHRGLAYAPYADALWCETSKPDIGEAREFAQAIHEKYPGKWLAYNCSPSFNWLKNLHPSDVARFQDALLEMGYKFQFITLAGFHSLNYGMFKLAHEYKTRKMQAYAELQGLEFKRAEDGYDAIKHQGFVGTGYFDAVKTAVVGETQTAAMAESTETEQFHG